MRPVFVIGCQRSGSTLLGAMLGAHPDIICVPEGQFIADLLADPNDAEGCDPSSIIDRIVRHWRFRVWEFDLGSDRPTPGEVEQTYRGAIEWLVQRYAAAHDRHGATIWVDQQPGHLFYLWQLLQHFPDAKVIHIIRDGRAVAASIMPLNWGPNEIHSAARFWKIRIGLGYAAGAFLGPDQLLHAHYEDLVQHPEATMRSIADFVGVEFRSCLLKSTGLRLPRFTEYQHRLIGAPLARDRINAWERKLTHRQIEIFESISSGLLEQLGYEPLAGFNPPRLGRMEKLVLIARDQIKRRVNDVKFWLRRHRYTS